MVVQGSQKGRRHQTRVWLEQVAARVVGLAVNGAFCRILLSRYPPGKVAPG